MIQFISVSKNFGRQQVIAEANFAIHDGERVGFVGPNGAGKSTLLEMLAGNSTPDHGDIAYPSSLRLGYVRQQLNAHSIDSTLIGYVENAMPEINQIQHEMDELESQLPDAAGADQERMLKRLGDLQTRFEHLGGYELRNRAETILSGLGFAVTRFNDPFRSFSGGWQIRAELSRVLASQPDVMILDEPTNYLDVPAVEWLRDYLRNYPGTLLLVSHDRYLLNSLTNVTLEVMGGHVTRYPGNYAQYMRERQARHELLLAQKRNIDRRKEQLERFIDRFKYKGTKAAQAQSRQKQLDKLEEVEIQEVSTGGPRIRLPEPPRCGDEVVRLEDLSFSYDGRREILSGCNLRLMRGDHAAFVGLNGMGKTTLLRLIAGKMQPTGGRVVTGHGVMEGYQSQDYAETMDPEATIYETAKSYSADRSESEVRALLGSFGFHGEAIEKKVAVLSGGEKVRLGLARLLLRPLNFLLLDEPTTHLDIHAREALQDALANYKGTIALVSHDIEFVRGVANTIFAMDERGITRYYGGYDYYRQKLQEEEAANAANAASSPAPAAVNAAPSRQPRPSRQPSMEKRSPASPGKADATARKSDSGGMNYRDLKRQESYLRQSFGKLRRPYEQKVAECEERIAALEEEQQRIYAQLNSPPEGESVDFSALNRRLAQINEESESQTWIWEEASTELEKLNQEFEERLAELKQNAAAGG